MATVRVEQGRVRFVYDDDLHGVLGRLGAVRIWRASTVEFDGARGGWMADLTATIPGCVLGPFATRGAALAAERRRLEEALSGGLSTGTGGEAADEAPAS